jgi:hypothetical protein
MKRSARGGGEKPYALLFEAMGRSKRASCWSTCRIFAGIVHGVQVKPNELAMANMLIERLKGEFEPEKYSLAEKKKPVQGAKKRERRTKAV